MPVSTKLEEVWGRVLLDKIMTEYQSGLSIGVVAETNGLKPGAVRKVLLRNGIIVRRRSVYRLKKKPSIKTCESETGKAYAAGLLDGEGTINLWQDKEHEKMNPSLSIANTDLNLLQFLTANFGGKIVGMRPNPSRFSKKPIYQWKVQSFIDVATFLEQVVPYLIGKKERAITALSHCKSQLQFS